MPPRHDALDLFHPIIRSWFTSRFAAPSIVQDQAWSLIARGEHVLISAPTGSGKTLSAFLWAINLFATGRDRPSHARVLYISPLKALNNDIRRNLEEPLRELRAAFAAAGEEFPEIHVAVRSGDSLPDERRRMLRRPPEIFITTPESLNILLTSLSGRRSLRGFTTVIVDEIHAVAPTKRGTHLMTAVERLVPLCGEFQRIALSATAHPLEVVAEFVGGYQACTPRPVRIVRAQTRKEYVLRVASPQAEDPGDETMWQAAIADFLGIIAHNRSTLFFCNSRRMAEKITRLINDAAGRDVAYSHHGSLSREIREVVERRFKAGELSAIVATSSLELGIDIGSVDEVVLVQTPSSVTSAVQRIGRSGHRVGVAARGTFYPLHGQDLLQAAALAVPVAENEIEELRPVEKPLDVLAQVILSLTAHEPRALDDLFTEVRSAWPYRDLSRSEFDLVIAMLAGRYAETRIRELRPRLAVDELRGVARAREGVPALLYASGGVIPDRGYYQLRIPDAHAKIGELDEEFVWERRVGDVFPFGNRAWRIERITANDVEVTAVSSHQGIIPFWRAEDLTRSFHLSERIGRFLEEADAALEHPAFRERLRRQHSLEDSAADRLIGYLSRQRETTGASLPHRHHLLIEHLIDAVTPAGGMQTVLHTLWGGAVNRPLALTLAAAWEERYGYPLEIYASNDCILVNLPDELRGEQILELIGPERVPALLRARLESSDYFGARFRENAQRALLLPRRRFRERMPLWLNRLRAKKLLSAVARFEDFPIVLETWRDCLQRDFDLPALERVLAELRDGTIRVSETRTIAGSPFASGIIWRQTNALMYADDSAPATLRTSLTDELLADIIRSPHLRPKLSASLIARFEAKAQRLAPGYAPGSSDELIEWLKERLFIPAEEWTRLLAAIERDHGVSADEFVGPIRDRIVERGHGPLAGMHALERHARISRLMELDIAGAPGGEAGELPPGEGESEDGPQQPPRTGLSDFLGEWLRFYGPRERGYVHQALGLPAGIVDEAIAEMAENETILIDLFRDPGQTAAREEICDRENLEILLRMRRAAERPELEPLPIAALPLFLARHQGLLERGDSPEALQRRLEQLFGYPARAAMWEGDILPARLQAYKPEWLDSLMTQTDLVWSGCGRETVSFALEDDLDLFPAPEMNPGPTATQEALAEQIEQTLAPLRGRLSFGDLTAAIRASSADLARALWSLAWRGRVANDTFEAVRKGVQTRFRAASTTATTVATATMDATAAADAKAAAIPLRTLPRRHFDRWRSTRPFAGNWFALPHPEKRDLDALEREELARERVRALLARYGVIFRELLANELPALRWSALFRTLRLMELSGEILTGRFFHDVPGIQFCSREALSTLTQALPEDAVYWMNATDPASPCGMGLPGQAATWPPRVGTTHLVFIGRRLVLISRRRGRHVEARLAPDDARLGECLELFDHLLRRPPSVKSLFIERINGEDAARSPYAPSLREFGFEAEYRSLVLWRSRR